MNALVAVSTTADGSMSSRDSDVLENRTAFLAAHGIRPEETVLVHLVYVGSDYCRYDEVADIDGGDGITQAPTRVNDALFTRSPRIALFLPLADCVGVALVDSKQQILGVSHMGRHNIEQEGAKATVQFMVDHFGSKPEDIEVYLSPAAGRDNYPLFAFDGRSLQDVAREQLLEASIAAEHIEAAPEDTTKDEKYFSHSEFLKGHRPTDGRHALVARLTT